MHFKGSDYHIDARCLKFGILVQKRIRTFYSCEFFESCIENGYHGSEGIYKTPVRFTVQSKVTARESEKIFIAYIARFLFYLSITSQIITEFSPGHFFFIFMAFFVIRFFLI